MRVLVVYGTTEGHTRKLADFMGERLKSAHCGVTVTDAAGAAAPDPALYDAVIVAASVHVARYQTSVVHYARHHREALNSMPSAFVSVSLSAAGDDPDDWAGLDSCVQAFEAQTGWKPKRIHHAAGAILFSAYEFFRKFAMKQIARARGQKVVTTEDYDYTDYELLGAFVDSFVGEVAPAPQPAGAV
jgi:menaquinone-dependent protoporphyrinogen oxidase